MEIIKRKFKEEGKIRRKTIEEKIYRKMGWTEIKVEIKYIEGKNM